jgi:exopolysaccharide biosynthesis protein
VSLTHRDSRLALGIRADGSVVVALTRFTGAGAIGARLPWGPTVLEMAAFMRSLGCARAMMLDGGLSSQLALRDANGTLGRWANWRAVPLAVVVSSRDAASEAARATR